MEQYLPAREQLVEWDSPAQLPNLFLVESVGEWGVDQGKLAIVQLARQLVRSRRASLILPAAGGADLRLAAAIGLPDDIVAGALAPLGHSVAGIVSRERRALLVNDERTFLGVLGTRAPQYRPMPFISVPVPLADGGCGALNVTGPIGRATFNDADLDGVQQLGRLAGASLHSPPTPEPPGQVEEATIRQQQQIDIQERERQRLARELHDEAGHVLTLAILRIDLERVKRSTAPAAREVLTDARDAIMEAATSLNDMAFRLRPRILEDLGLFPALRTLVAQAQVPDVLQIVLECDDDVPEMRGEVELVAFRIVQEALTNIRKHAAASSASIRLSFFDQALRVVVQDNGVGIDVPGRGEGPLTAAGGEGLRGMRERVEVLGGSLAIDARRQGGTRVAAILPLRSRGYADERA